MYVSYKFRIYPTKKQQATILRWEYILRTLWNLALEQYRLKWDRPRCERLRPCSSGCSKTQSLTSGKDPHIPWKNIKICFVQQSSELTALRDEFPLFKEPPRAACEFTLQALEKAWIGFTKRKTAVTRGGKDRGEPRFKGKNFPVFVHLKVDQRHPSSGIRDGQFLCNKLGKIKTVLHCQPAGPVKNYAIVRDCDQWFVSILCEVPDRPSVANNMPSVGLDVGIAHMCTSSDGKTYDLPNNSALQERITKAQQSLSRKQKGSANREKAKLKLAKLYRKLRRINEYDRHVQTTSIARQYGRVYVEDLDIKEMTKNISGTVENPGHGVKQKSSLNREILKNSWSEFVRCIEYKVVWNGGKLVRVNPAYTSQTCNACGHVSKENRKTQESFVCVSCGHTDNADVNAAKNIMESGKKLEASGGIEEKKKDKIRAVWNRKLEGV